MRELLARLMGRFRGPAPARPGGGGRRGDSIWITRLKGFYSAFGYNAARVADRDGRTATMGSGDTHSLYDRERLVNQSRDFARNNGIYSGMLERAAAYIVGNGFTLQAKTEDADWNTKAEAVWQAFWRRPEIRGVVSGRGLERMVCRELLTCGDFGVLKTNEGKIQIVEAEQIKGAAPLPDGIDKDGVGRPTRYWVSPWGKSGGPEVAKATAHEPANFLHVARLERPSASRGVPPCQASFPMLHRINDVCDSEAIAWQMLSKLAISINRDNAGVLALQTSIEDPNKSGSDTDGDFASRVHELDQALIFHGERGEEIKGVERNIPGKEFPASITMFLRLLGLPLGLPLEIILLDWTKSNYSQSRAVLEQAYTSFLAWQYLLEDFFYVPLYEWVILNAVEADLLPASEQATKHEWIKPTFPWIDQLQEAEAYGAKIDRSFCTLAHALKSLNLDREEVLAAREREYEVAIEIAARLEKKTGVKVPWEPFAGLKVPPAAPAPPMAEEPKGGEKAAKEEPAKEEEKEEARAEPPPPAPPAPPPPRMVRTVTEILKRDEHGRSAKIEQTHFYERESVTTVPPPPGDDPK